MTKLKSILTAIAIGYVGLLKAQHTTIPDPIFEAFLIEQGFDDVIDGQVVTAGINNITTFFINETTPIFPIEDLTGIQDFVSLEFLSINMTNCTNIDFGNLTNLRDLDLIMNTNLEEINLTGLNNLEELSASDSNLNNLDISQNLSLKEFGMSGNTGDLNTLNFSQYSNLILLGIANSNFIEIDIRNGANQNIEFFTAVGNPNLTCIFVDDADFSAVNWTNIDPTTTFVETEEECEALSTEDFVDINFSIHPNPANQYFDIKSNQEINQIEIFDLSGKKIKTFKQNLDSYPVTDLSKGFYILNIQTNFGNSSKKLIIN